MSIFAINHNIPSLNVQRNLNTVGLGMSKSMEKLSSGLRINTGWDGPADLVISERMRSDIIATKTAIRNNQEAMNLMGSAEGALNEISKLLTDIKSKVVHALNTGVVGATGDAQVDADQAEYDAAVNSIDDIIGNTTYAGVATFGADLDFQTGITAADTITSTLLNIAAGDHGLTAGDDVTDSGTLALVDAAIEYVATLRGDIGSFMKGTLQANIDNLTIGNENLTASESYIRDTNMAEEISNYTKHQILVQAGMSVLAQANVSSQSVLQLLG